MVHGVLFLKLSAATWHLSIPSRCLLRQNTMIVIWHFHGGCRRDFSVASSNAASSGNDAGASSSSRTSSSDDGIPTAGDSCVDAGYRVRGVSQLRVIDGSTFPTSPGTNPMATCMMLGR